jgi:phosphopantetheine adenylyltransferase
VVCGGTLDPATLGHCENIGNAIDVGKYTEHPVILNIHSRNPNKKPIPLEERRGLALCAIRDFFGESARVILCVDPKICADQTAWNQVKKDFEGRLLLVESTSPDDNKANKTGRLIQAPRVTPISSTMVRKMLVDGEMEALRYAVTPSVFRYLLENGRRLYDRA